MGRPSKYPAEFRQEAVRLALVSDACWGGATTTPPEANDGSTTTAPPTTNNTQPLETPGSTKPGELQLIRPRLPLGKSPSGRSLVEVAEPNCPQSNASDPRVTQADDTTLESWAADLIDAKASVAIQDDCFFSMCARPCHGAHVRR